mgnify:FL=1
MTDAETQVLTNFTTTSTLVQGNGSTASALTIAIDGTPALTSRPYLRYRVGFNDGIVAPSATVDTGTVTPVVHAVRVRFFNAASIYYWSQQIDLGPAASGWGRFLINETANGATRTWYLRAAASGTALNTAVFADITTNVTNGTDPQATVAWARYAQWVVRVQPGASASAMWESESQDLTWPNANEVSSGPPASAWADRRYHLWVQERNNTYNNVCFVLDSRFAWTKFRGFGILSASVFKDRLLLGVQRSPGATSNLSAGRILMPSETSNDDDGTAVEWFIQSKDYTIGDLRSPIAVRGIEMIARTLSIFTPPPGGPSLGGIGFMSTPGVVYVTMIGGGQAWAIQQVQIGGAGVEYGYSGFGANRWYPTVGFRILGGELGKKPQIDQVTVNVWKKEPQNR